MKKAQIGDGIYVEEKTAQGGRLLQMPGDCFFQESFGPTSGTVWRSKSIIT